jgi:hypothetical protein
MGAFLEWRKKGSWTPLPKVDRDSDVEDKPLYQDNIETSSQQTVDQLEEAPSLSNRDIFAINKSWLFLTTFNTILFCVSVILNKSTFWDFERSCIKQTSSYCTVFPATLRR